MKTEWNELTALQNALTTDSADLTAVYVDQEYQIVDVDARQGVVDNRERIDALSAGEDYLSGQIDNLSGIVAGGVSFRGKTAEALKDGEDKNPVAMASGDSLVPRAGDMVIVPSTITGKEDREFIYDGANWNEFGEASQLKALAYKNSASADYTPAGTIGVSSNGAQTPEITATFTATNGITGYVTNYTPGNYTPEGTVNVSAYTPAGDITVSPIQIGTKTTTATVVTAAAFEGT